MRGSFRKKGRSRENIGLAFRDVVPAETIRVIVREHILDPMLWPVDRHMQRWAVTQGSGLPDSRNALRLKSSLTPLSDEEAIITDQVVCKLPPYWRSLARFWYLSEMSTDQIATELKVARRKLYDERKIMLGVVFGLLNGVGLSIPAYERVIGDDL